MNKVLWLLVVITLPCFAQAQVLLPHASDGKYGFVNQSGEWVVPPVYDKVKKFNGKYTTGLKNDSIFIINRLGKASFVDRTRDITFFINGYLAIQNTEGKWAFGDSLFNMLTDYEYNTVKYSYGYYVVSKNGLSGVLDKNFITVLDFKFNSLRFINAYYIYGKISNSKLYFSTYGGIKALNTISDRMNYYVSDLNLILQSKVESSVYNLEGDSIFTCKQCGLSGSINDLLLISYNEKVLQQVISANDGQLIHYSNDTMPIVIDDSLKAMFDMNAQKLIFNSAHLSSVFDTLNVEGYEYLDTNSIRVVSNGLIGVVTFDGQIIVPFKYISISAISNKNILCRNQNGYCIAKISNGEIIYTIGSFSQIQATDDNILMTKSDGSAIIIHLDSISNITDSFTMNDFSIVSIGTRSGFRKRDITNTTLGNNSSKSNRWFQSDVSDRFGLLGFKDGDTLIKTKFNSIIGLNDSVDFVQINSRAFRTVAIKGLGNLTFTSKYGIVNNRTGKYLFPPVLPYINFDMLNIENNNVLMVVLPSGKYCLLDMRNFTLIKSSICDYIAPPVNGHLRLFYQPVFISETELKKIENTKYKLLVDAKSLDKLGPTSFNRPDAIYMYAKLGVNLSNLNGEILLTNHKLFSFIDEGKYGKFISYTHGDSAGVVSAKNGIIVRNLYYKIWRLKQNDSFFVFQTNHIRYGYIDNEGNEITKPIYNQTLGFKNGYSWARIRDDNYIIDKDGNNEYIYSGKFKVKSVYGGITTKKVNKGWQIIDVNGNLISDEIYKNVMPFAENTISVQTKKGWGLMNANGYWIVEPVYNSYLAQNLYSVVLANDEKCFFFNSEGQIQSKRKIKGRLKAFNDSMYVENVSNYSKYYFADGTEFDHGNKFKKAVIVRNDSFFLFKSNKVILLNSKGKILDKYQHYNGISYVKRGNMELTFSDRLATVVVAKVRPSYKVIDPNIFSDSVTSFTIKSPFAGARSVIKNEHMQSCFHNNAFVFRVGKKMVLSDSVGTVLADEEFIDISHLEGKYYKVTMKNDLGLRVYGVIDNMGMWVIEARYDYIDKFYEDIAIYGMFRSYYISNIEGELISSNELMELDFEKGYIHLISDVGSAWWRPDGTFVTGFSK